MTKSTEDEVGLGTAAIGRPEYININKEDSSRHFSLETFRQDGMRLIEEAYQGGIRYFDTAPGYGMAEQMLIDWLTAKNDSSIELATKWGYTYIANFEPNAKKHEVKEHSLEKLKQQWLVSKKLLPNLTTYQIHSATFETGILENTEVLRFLGQLRDQYGIMIGITTTGANQKEVIKKALDIHVGGKELFDVFQATYNIFDQSIQLISEEISNRNKRLVIKEAMANGRIFPNDKYPNYSKAYRHLKTLASKHNVNVDAIALRFCLDSISVYKVLSGAARPEHLSSNLQSGDFQLESGDIAILKDLAINPKSYWDERKLLAWN